MNTFEWSRVLGIKFTSWFYKSNNIYHIEIFFWQYSLFRKELIAGEKRIDQKKSYVCTSWYLILFLAMDETE